MNWKLLFVALTCAIVGISARPADETKPIEITQVPTTATAAATTREDKSTTTKSPPAVTSPTTTTIRYLQASMMPTKPTNSKLKYSNNYANLITKYTLLNNQNYNHNNNRNVSSDNSNKYVTLHDVVVAGSSLPSLANTLIRPATETTSNSSSKPIVFLSADDTTTSKSTTKREYHPPLKFNVVSPWPSEFDYANNLLQTTSRPNNRKPVIHKILSKWSDNPHDVFVGNKNDYSDEKDFTIFSTRWPKPHPQVDDLTHNLYQNVILPDLVASSSFNGMGQVGHDIMMNPLGTVPPPSIFKNVNKNNSPSRPTNCKTTKIKVGNHIVNGLASKENCDDIELQIENSIHQNSNNNANAVTESSNEEMYDFSINDKFQDVLGFNVNSQSTEKTNAVLSEDIPMIVNSINEIRQPLAVLPQTSLKNDRKKKKKKPQSANQIDYEDDGGFPTMIPTSFPDDGGDGGDIGSMMMTMVTMMAIFNPLNFGVWGFVIAPFAAVLLAGFAYGLYHVAGMKEIVKQVGYSHPQEVIVKNKILHSPIPIKIVHKHLQQAPTAAAPHFVIAPPMHSYGPPSQSYGPSLSDSYGVPEMFMDAYDHYMRQKSNSKGSKGKKRMHTKNKHFAEPPMEAHYPTAQAGFVPHKRRIKYRYKLGFRPALLPVGRYPVQTLHKLKNQNFKLL